MATLVLTAAGTLLGGPIGGAIGALAGQMVDQNILLKPKGRQGPRLNDLAVQTSTYGTQVPKLFGMLRVAGTVIWATDLREERNKSGGGKGRPSTTTYSYSASFAVLLSGRAVRAIRRIWADGNLLRGAAGDFKTETRFRFYPGSENQPIDPLIAAAEGIGATPAYRGCAYAVFQDFQLGDYGNRIPSLTFEVEADAGPVEVGEIAAILSGGAVGGDAGRSLAGFAASGDSVRGVMEVIGDAMPLSLMDDGERLAIAGEGAPLTIDPAEGGAGAGEAAVRDGSEIQSALTVPVEVSVAYYEPARDYQTGMQRARRPGAGRRGERIELPAVLTAPEAKAIAEERLARMMTERAGRTLRLGWRRLGVRPGDRVEIAGEAGSWRVAGWRLDRMVVELNLVRWRSASAALPASAEPGRSVGAPDQIHGPTVVHLLDIPALGDEPLAAPRLFVAAAGASLGWRRASLSVSTDGGTSWQAIGGTAAPATMGVALGVLPPAEVALFDHANSIVVELLHEAMTLHDADEAGLVAGRNLAVLGRELIQFGRAEPLGAGRWRLSRLVRGRRGSEWAMDMHQAGERFVLIEAETLVPYDAPLASIGGTVRLMAMGVGDLSAAAEGEASSIGESIRPPAPTHLVAHRRADGGVDLQWIRRSRSGWRWIDLVDAPLGEEREAYVMTITPAAGAQRTIELEEPAYHYAADVVAADLAIGPVSISVAQRGSLAMSRAAAITLSNN